LGVLGNQILPFNPIATSGKPRDAQRFNGDNSTTTFTLNYRVDNPTDLEVFVENVQQEPLTAYDAIGSQLIFTEAPPTGTNNIYVVHRNLEPGVYAQIPDGAVTFNKLANNIRLFTTDNFVGDGGTIAFGLSSEVPDANTLMVTVDGVFQRAPIHYTATGNTITFTSAPPSSSNVHVRHLGFRTTQSITALPANTTISQPILSGATLSAQTNVSGNVIPSANTTYDLGSASLRWANIYTGDLHLSNEGRDAGNLVDGTKGNWTVQEGETDLYLINNRTGKKYRFAIEEVR
jgi:hypothetical protein